jgi:hypothetical protein
VEDLLMLNGISSIERLNLYENGKHRRYTLLFSVNGGAFAVAKLLTGGEGKAATVLGHLTLAQLCWGMVFFTIAMMADIFFFGYKMKRDDSPIDVFGLPGQLVLLSVGLLICGGWFLVGIRGC